MTWQEFINQLNINEINEIEFDDGTIINVADFESRFNSDYDNTKPYESLSNSSKTTTCWQNIFDNLKSQGIL